MKQWLENKRDNMQEKVEKSAWTLSGMNSYQRVRVELVIYAFLICVGLMAVFYNGAKGNTFSVISYSILSTVFFLSFLGKSAQFRHFYRMNQLKIAEEKIE